MKSIIIGAALFLFFAKALVASHIVGGEMYYHFIGNDQYEITLVVYRDCYYGQAPYDDQAAIGVFDSQGSLVQNVLVPIADSTHVPNAINTPCLTPPTDVCYEVAHYYTTVTLPPAPGGYTLAYQRCCRNYSCINIYQYTGATYTAVIPDQQYAADDNPVYDQLPPTFICAGAPFTFDHSATDADGDSLVYSMYTPYDGADQFTPRPSPPSSPPYAPITFQPPYTLANVMGGVPMSINPQTGILTATPSSVGQFVYGILVEEYRNGVLIGETRRDFQVNVTTCENYTVASIFSPAVFCGSLEATFLNTSYGASSYSWTFGDPTTANDTSSLENPTYTYPDTGIYPLMLIAYADDHNCNDTAYGEARVFPEFFAHAGLIPAVCSNTVQFIDSSYSQSNATNYWLWDFGDGHYSGSKNPVHSYAAWGNYSVQLIASSDSGCTDTSVVMVDIDPVPVSNFTTGLDTCAKRASFHNTSGLSDTYLWQFGDNSSTQELHPEHEYQLEGTVMISLIAYNDSGCSDTSWFSLQLAPVPVADFTWDVAACDSLVHFHNLSVNAPTFTWAFGDNTAAFNPDPVHLYLHSGSFLVTMQALGANLTCTDHVTKTIFVNRKPTARFSVTVDTCLLALTTGNQSEDASHYMWNFSDGYTGYGTDVQHFYSDHGSVSVQLIAANDSGCVDTVVRTAEIPPLPVSDFSWSHLDCDSLVTFAQQAAHAVSFRWLFGDGESNDDPQAEHIYRIAGDIPVQLIATSMHGCRDTAGKDIHIIIQTPADFEMNLDSCSGAVQFSNRSPIAVNYDWNFGDQGASTAENPVHIYQANLTDYTVTLTVNKESSCQEFIQKPLRYEVNDGELIHVPNSFTPNGDGLNDIFQLSIWKPCEIYSITIFDRWGHAVYRNSDAYTTAWDGTFSGHSVPEDVYVYVLQGSHSKHTGHVLLMK